MAAKKRIKSKTFPKLPFFILVLVLLLFFSFLYFNFPKVSFKSFSPSAIYNLYLHDEGELLGENPIEDTNLNGEPQIENASLTEAEVNFSNSSTFLISTDVSKSVNWHIEKSGIEKSLDVSYKNLNETTTEFCINFIDKEKYEKDLSETGKDIKSIPITELSKYTTLKLEKSDIDLSKDNCFKVNYDKQDNGLSFKIGYESVIINSTFDTDATEGVGKNIYRDIYGCLNVAYTSAGNDIGFARSCSNGVTWTSNEIFTGTFDGIGITGNSTGGLLIYWTDSSDINGIFSNNNGNTWSSTATLGDTTPTLNYPSCDVDSHDIYHCCAVNSGRDTYYFNSSSWNSELKTYSGAGASAVACYLSVDINDTVLILNADTSNNNLSITYKTYGSGTWIAMDIYNPATIGNALSLSLSNAYIPDTGDGETYDNFIAYQNGTSTDVCLFIGDWQCSSISSAGTTDFLSAAENNLGQFLVLTGSSSTAGGSINLSNSTSFPDFSTTVLSVKGDFPSIADQVFPATAKMNNKAYIVFTNATGVYYTFYNVNNNAPVVTMVSPVNTSNFNVSQVTFNVSIDRNVSYCGLSINSGLSQSMTINASLTGAGWTNTSIKDGSYTFQISCNESTNAFGYSSIYNFYVDTVYPLINFTSPTPGNGTTQTGTSIFVNVTSNDSTSNIGTFIDFDNSLVSWWRMDNLNSSGGVVDYMGRNNGSKGGQAHQVTNGKMGKGMSFDGYGDYIEFGRGNFNYSTVSVCMWINQVSGSSVRTFMTSGNTSSNPWVLAIGSSGTLYFTNNTASHPVSTSNSLASNVWKFICGISPLQSLYVDGKLQTTTTTTDWIFTTNARIGSSTWSIDGTVDDVMIFNRSLSAGEIQALYANTSVKYLGVNFTGLSEGSHSFKAYTQDLAGNVNSTAVRTITISSDIEYPIFYDYSDDNSTLVSNGIGSINVSVNSTNGTVILNINHTTIQATNLSANLYNVSYNFLSSGVYEYNWTSYGNGTSHLVNTSLSRFYTVNTSAGDAEYPQFSSITTSIANNTQYYLNNIVQFNVTITSTNSTAGIEFNGVNYTLSNVSSATIFNYTFPSLSAGTYGYYFWAKGNGTSHLLNRTIGYNYTVAKNSSLVLGLTATTPIIYPTSTDFTSSGCPAELTCTLNLTNKVFGVGVINANYSTAGNTNYSTTSAIKAVTINQNTSECGIYFNQTSPLEYPNNFGVFANCTSAFTMYRNGTSINNGSTQNLGAGIWNFTVNRNDNANYSSTISNKTFTISQNNTILILLLLNGLNDNLSITFPQQFNASYSGTNQTALTIIANSKTLAAGTNYSWGAGSWIVNYSAQPNQNYSGFEAYLNLTINKHIGALSFKLNGIATDLTIIYPQQVNASAVSSSGQDVIITRNGIDVTTENNLNVTLQANITHYDYWGIAQENENYSILGKGLYLTVNKGVGIINGTINGTQGNFTVFNGTANQNIYLNVTNITGYGTGKIYINGTLINSGNMPLFNLTNLSLGFYNITFIYDGDDNYTSDINVWWANITIADITPPTFTNLRNFIHTVNTSFSKSITATDASGISSYWLNDTSYFTISNAGLITNNTNLSRIEIHWLNISVNDTVGNIVSGIFYINITIAPPVANVTIVSIAQCRYKKFMYYNTKLVWFRETNCI